MRNAKYCVFWPSIRENHNIFRYQQVRIRFNLLVRVSDSPDRNVSFLTAPNSLSLFLGQSVARLEVGAILPTVLEFLALSNLLAPVAEGTVGQPKALTCLRQRSAVVHSFRDQLVGFAAILVTDQFSLSPQIACAFFCLQDCLVLLERHSDK